YGRFETYPGAASPDDSGGGGHIGQGGIWGWNSGTSYGSIFRPQEAGGGAAIGDANYVGGIGGGSVHINATTSATIDGTIRANGYENTTWGSAAGGSVWITTNTLAGAGSIEARGSGDTNNRSGGGGGAIALEYQAVSGTLTSNLSARGGISIAGANQVRNGSAGSIYLKGPASTYGDLIIDNKGTLPALATSLPSLGSLSALSVASKTATTDSLFIPSSFAGHSVRVIAPDGTERGTWRIASVQNHPSVRAFSGFNEVLTQDAVAYDGYIMYCPAGYPVGGATRTFLAVRNNAGVWQYDNDGSSFVTFTPTANDFIVASFSKDTSAITNISTYSCAAGCAPINGVPVLEMVSGALMANYRGVASTRSPVIDNAEIYVAPRFGDNGPVFSAGRAAITLEDGPTPVDMRAGDTLRGIYRFDNVNVGTARLTSRRDLFVSTAAPTLDAQSTLAGANAAPPKVDLSKISYSRGLIGAVLVGAPGAVSDSETVDIVARNTTRVQPRKPPTQNFSWVDMPWWSIGTGGTSIRKLDNGDGNWATSGLSSVESITGSGYLQFRSTTPARESIVGFTVNDTTWNWNEPGLNGFHLNHGTYEVWVNGSYSSGVTGPYTTSTLFRIEKTPAA
ncbi:MAG TPA: hypothetical protein VN181_10560, partial [Thermoanaerobaculia bacterium]|nr:hypothetical protein [Thermoanaerobaculia bacterium]